MAGALRTRVGWWLIHWGRHQSGGVRAVAPTRLRALLRRAQGRYHGAGVVYLGRGVRLRPPPTGARLTLGRGVRLADHVAVWWEGDGAQITIGERTFVNRRTELRCRERIEIGAGCVVSWDVQILDTDYHSIDGRPATAPVYIADRVWIGARADILKGVRIGEGAVVAARAVVTRDVPPRALVAGNPARVLREDVRWEL